VLLALALAGPAGSEPATAGPTLTVPFLPQTDALCGGAAAAMVFRYWGHRRADVQQFEPLVDRRAGGIADTVLVDAVRRGGWNAVRLDGSVDAIQEHIRAGHPLILLIADRPSRYHYVVAVGADETHVFLHDPTWGPSRRLEFSELLRVWRPTQFWTLLITPTDAVRPPSASFAGGVGRKADSVQTTEAIRLKPDPTTGIVGKPDLTTGMRKPDPVNGTIRLKPDPTVETALKLDPANTCDRLLDEALDEIDAGGVAVADEALGRVRQQCPTASGPIRELAGVRFSQERWQDAAALAEEALRHDANDPYSWDVLGSSRFIQNDTIGALQAWNRIGKPTLDSVQIAGLTRTRYSLVADVAGLSPNTLLTDRQLTLAGRRLQLLPDRLMTSVDYRQEADGFATVNVGIVERSRWPRGWIDWTAIGGQAVINREAAVAVPGKTGQGEVWGASWRWWAERPRVAASFSAPRAGRLGGVWRVDASWEAETYMRDGPNQPLREDRAHGSVSVGNWLTPSLRYEASTGLDAWDRTRRALFVGALADRRFAGDRIAFVGGATYWSPTDTGSAFSAASIRGWFRSSANATGFVAIANVGVDMASRTAPLAIWSGAGEGRARPGLLRAHTLLHDGIIDGPVFGRRVGSATLELQRWLNRPAAPRIGVAVFADAADAAHRLTSSSGKAFQVDVGAGMRVRLPGTDSAIRLDYAHGVRDRAAQALTIGWSIAPPESSPRP
jgi:predicted double-glycine peptidase